MAQAQGTGGRNAALGCLFTLPGFFGGGMIGVLVGKIVGSLQGCRPPEGFPACQTFQFLVVGGAVGAVVLPGMILWHLTRPAESKNRQSDRG